MMTSDRWFAARVRDLYESECWELLGAREVGRIGFVDEFGPVVVPVTYVVHDGSVVFRVAPYSSLGRHVPGALVAIEVDEIDDVTRSGWSVLVRGRAEVIHPEEIPELSESPEPWAEGRRPLHLRVEPEDMTGRRLLPP
jgi:nitroimidazol reductase NimA-like FMN-containing flavoprotein (pyridoxamine 5'-phosphate oxidase superfamily)